MELIGWLKENDAGPIIKSVFALGFCCYYIWLRVSSRMASRKCTATVNTNRPAPAISGAIPSHQLASTQCQHKELYQLSSKELLHHLIDVRERLANIEGRMGIYPPRRGVEPPMPEPAPEQERSELSRS